MRPGNSYGKTMLAIRVHEFGGPDVLRLEDVARPEPGPDEIRRRIRALNLDEMRPVEALRVLEELQRELD